jgi:AcrR family transcriptional regulator
MSRPRTDADRRILKAAMELARERGCGAVSVREVCRRAKVNLGLFHYHYKSRQALVERVLQEGYREFFARLKVSVAPSLPPPDRLRGALRAIARFSRDHASLCAGMLKDALHGDRQVAAFAAEAFPHHIPIVLGIYEEGVQGGAFRRLPIPRLLAFLMGVINAPILMQALFDEHGVRRPFGRDRRAVEAELLSDEAIEDRLDLILAALTAPVRTPPARPRRKAR